MIKSAIDLYIQTEVKNEMFNFIKQSAPKNVKYSYTPHRLRQFRIFFRNGAIEEIKKIKGWKSDAEMGRELMFTRAYINNLKKRRTPVTQDVITRVAYALGSIDRNWWIFYEICDMGFKDTSDVQYNQAKHLGQMPFEKYSTSAQMRGMDYEVEKQENQI